MLNKKMQKNLKKVNFAFLTCYKKYFLFRSTKFFFSSLVSDHHEGSVLNVTTNGVFESIYIALILLYFFLIRRLFTKSTNNRHKIKT